MERVLKWFKSDRASRVNPSDPFGQSSSPVKVQKRKVTIEPILDPIQFTYELKNFEKIVTQGAKGFRACKYEFNTGEDINFPTRWKLYFRPDSENGTVGVSLKLLQCPECEQNISARFKVIIFKTSGLIYSQLDSGMRSYERSSWICNSNALNPQKIVDSGSILVNGSLTFQVELEIIAPPRITESHLGETPAGKKARLDEEAKAVIVEDWRRVMDSPDRDIVSETITLVADGDKMMFKVHKALLSAKSPVFTQIFQSQPALERIEIDLPLLVIFSEELRIIVDFMYKGTLDDKWIDCVLAVLSFAEKYEMTLLREYCNETLGDACNVNNALSFLKLSRNFRLEKAEKQISEYIEEHSKEIFETIR